MGEAPKKVMLAPSKVLQEYIQNYLTDIYLRLVWVANGVHS